MYCTIKSACLYGLKSIEVNVEVSATTGLPQEIIIGLPDIIVKESKNRIKSAIKLAGFEIPARAYTINLSPVDVQKKSNSLELAIAVGFLSITKQFNPSNHYCFLGSLSLDGSVEPIRQLLPLIHFYERSVTFIISKKNVSDIQYLDGIQYKSISHLSELSKLDEMPISTISYTPKKTIDSHMISFDSIIGHHLGKQACALSIAGSHPLLFIGSPGIGKTLLIDHIKSILPPISNNESIENCCIESLLKQDPNYSSIAPFRSPHHTISHAGMIGGQNPPKPGEITRANHGILFLDELGEYQRSILETLREPLETHSIQISRAGTSIEYPANFLLLAAMNPCYCGYYFHHDKHCNCTSSKIRTYWQRLSKPLLDRFSICLILSQPNDNQPTISHKELLQMIQNAHSIALKRNPNGWKNQYLPTAMLMEICRFDAGCLEKVDQFCAQHQLSMRARIRLIKLSLTIADAQQSSTIRSCDVSLAIQLSQHNHLP